MQSVAYSLMFLAEKYQCDRRRRKEIQKRGQTHVNKRRGTARCYHHSTSWCLFWLPSATLTNLLETCTRDPTRRESQDCNTNTSKAGLDKQLNNIFMTSCSGTNGDTRDFKRPRCHGSYCYHWIRAFIHWWGDGMGDDAKFHFLKSCFFISNADRISPLLLWRKVKRQRGLTSVPPFRKVRIAQWVK